MASNERSIYPGTLPLTEKNKDRLLRVIYGIDLRDVPTGAAGEVFYLRLRREFSEVDHDLDQIYTVVGIVADAYLTDDDPVGRRLRRVLSEYLFGQSVLY